MRPRRKTEPLPTHRADELRRYRWSSHRAYAALARRPQWLSQDWLKYWGRGADAPAAYRRQIAQVFGKPVDNPWDQLRGGLVLGSERLWCRVKQLLAGKDGHDERRWHQRESWQEQRQRLQVKLADEADPRVRIWARVRAGGERRVDVARECGYRDGSAVTHLIKRLDTAAIRDRKLAQRLRNLS